MTTNTMPVRSRIDQSILDNMVEVKETIAPKSALAKQTIRSFGIVDLWNLRRNARTASNR